MYLLGIQLFYFVNIFIALKAIIMKIQPSSFSSTCSTRSLATKAVVTWM
jgi:hypothetical protein